MTSASQYLLKKCPTSTELMQFLLHIPDVYLQADDLVRQSLKINLSRKDIQRLESEANKLWEKSGSPERGTLSLLHNK